MLPRLSLPPPTLSVSVLPSTSPSSTTRSSTPPTVHATSPSRPLTTPLPSSTLCQRSLTATAPSSCSSSVTTSPSGLHPTEASLSPPPRHPRPRTSLLRPPPRPLPPRSQRHKRFSVHILRYHRLSASSQQRRGRVVFLRLSEQGAKALKACSKRNGCCGALRRGNELIPQNAFAT